jgi:hypothetical protein
VYTSPAPTVFFVAVVEHAEIKTPNKITKIPFLKPFDRYFSVYFNVYTYPVETVFFV